MTVKIDRYDKRIDGTRLAIRSPYNKEFTAGIRDAVRARYPYAAPALEWTGQEWVFYAADLGPVARLARHCYGAVTVTATARVAYSAAVQTELAGTPTCSTATW